MAVDSDDVGDENDLGEILEKIKSCSIESISPSSIFRPDPSRGSMPRRRIHVT